LVGVILLAAIAAVSLKRLWPGPHQPFEYMVAGTGVTAILLLAAFVVLVRRRRL